MLSVVSAVIAYIIAWITGFLVTNVAYPLFVFRTRTLTFNKSAIYCVYYVVNFLFSLTLLEVIIRYEILTERMAPILLLSIIVPVNFIASRLIFQGGRSQLSSEKRK